MYWLAGVERQKVLVLRLFIVVFIAISAIIGGGQYKDAVTFAPSVMGFLRGAVAGAFLTCPLLLRALPQPTRHRNFGLGELRLCRRP